MSNRLKATIEITYEPNPKSYIQQDMSLEQQAEEDRKFLQEHPTEFFVFANKIEDISTDIEITEG